ncbi:CRISPR-associated exonuclease, Cas4 family [Orenia metallireducens]|uniref:CRISPR-associated exonuclease Cas4 n=1 Tax=Orenia metallireducens TaxID=1413210 RepID=A0A285HZH8_9FIRM|nr:CRISPR-associated protein Cas4 [Orenia metallireducens]SNY41132.1 CRISPR-associated exonuclease, Cas4 family [Orenia metallireducens]
MEEKIYVPLSAINAYNYCPYRVYLEYVRCEWQDNAHTIEGVLRHERAHSGNERYDKDKKQSTQIYVKSDKYRLVGKIDIVEEKLGKIYPVEYKKGRAGKWINDHLQLCAEALCLEEQLDIRIDKGYLWYFGSRSREEVEFDSKLRKETIDASREILKIMKGKMIPESKYSNRCRACSMSGICLPKEVEILGQLKPKI